MKELKIEAPNGYEIDKENSTIYKIVFKEIKNALPKSWEELEGVKGYCVANDTTIIETLNLNGNYWNKNIFATKEQAEASRALAQLSLLREVYRDGWLPDWEAIIHKHCIIYNKNKLIITCNIYHCAFLSFQSREIAEEFLNNFRELIEQAKPLMS